MAREFAKAFYNSKEWIQCRESYIKAMPKYKRGLCECCYNKGKHVLGQELHHKIWLTPKNIHDRNITLNHDNLILLCFDCHREKHNQRKQNQYVFNDRGELIPNEKYIAPIK
ncbi:MAG: HNH endonuclease [Amedibacillus dolichus]|nr:MAG: HNH endonuclease [Amedibacillus dolichus]